jgi:hypothetical protein
MVPVVDASKCFSIWTWKKDVFVGANKQQNGLHGK